MGAMIDTVKDILGHRIEGEPVSSGKWLVWKCNKSAQTMSKFVSRVTDAGVRCFCRDGKFGVLVEDLDWEAAEAKSKLASTRR